MSVPLEPSSSSSAPTSPANPAQADALETPLTSPESSTPGFTLADDVIPSHRPPRTLVLCFDGTGDQFDADVSPYQCHFI